MRFSRWARYRPAIVPAMLEKLSFAVAVLILYVVELVREIYEGRRFDLMPVLGAAVSDASCTEPSVLEHRSLPNHAKGCFLVDMLLGKE